MQPTCYKSNQQPSNLDLITTLNDSLLFNIEYPDHIGKFDHVVLKIKMQDVFTCRSKLLKFKKIINDFNQVNDKLSWLKRIAKISKKPTVFCLY